LFRPKIEEKNSAKKNQNFSIKNAKLDLLLKIEFKYSEREIDLHFWVPF
jgi:hypothetical protein